MLAGAALLAIQAMQTPFSRYWQPWTLRFALGAGTLVMVAWLLAPGIRSLLQSAPIAQTDRQVAAWLHAASSPLLIESMRWVSLVHGIAGIFGMAAIAAAVLWWNGKCEALPTLIASVAGGTLINVLVKLAVRRDRPDWGYGLDALESFSFPSGHTEGAMLFYGVVVIWLWPRMRAPWMRVALSIGAASLVLLVAASRIVLGLHFLSDCVAAVLEALLWLAICLAAAHPARAFTYPVGKPP